MCHEKLKKLLQRRSRRNNYVGIMLLSFLLVFGMVTGGTIAFLTTKTEPVVNMFNPSHVDCTVTERFNGTTKSDINVTNTGDTDAYIRVKLVSYRVNDQGQHIGGTAEIPAFTPGAGWVPYGTYYYYTQPVAPGAKPAADLISSIDLTGSYTDADGGKQVIEVMAEAIQATGVDSNGTPAVKSAWGANVSADGTLGFN